MKSRYTDFLIFTLKIHQNRIHYEYSAGLDHDHALLTEAISPGWLAVGVEIHVRWGS